MCLFTRLNVARFPICQRNPQGNYSSAVFPRSAPQFLKYSFMIYSLCWPCCDCSRVMFFIVTDWLNELDRLGSEKKKIPFFFLVLSLVFRHLTGGHGGACSRALIYKKCYLMGRREHLLLFMTFPHILVYVQLLNDLKKEISKAGVLTVRCGSSSSYTVNPRLHSISRLIYIY